MRLIHQGNGDPKTPCVLRKVGKAAAALSLLTASLTDECSNNLCILAAFDVYS
jgi:hypothetical protein